MAGRRNQETLDEVFLRSLECPVCKNLFEWPRQLKCGHSFCMSCIQKILEQANRRRIACPECRQECSSDDLRRNFKVEELVEHFKSISPLALDLQSEAAANQSRSQVDARQIISERSTYLSAMPHVVRGLDADSIRQFLVECFTNAYGSRQAVIVIRSSQANSIDDSADGIHFTLNGFEVTVIDE